MKESLERFIEAQSEDYQLALSEIESGVKRTHWMWFIFPQIAGLGLSTTSQFYAIRDLEEATAYLRHEILGTRLIEISAALLQLPTNNAHQIFGSPDDMKLQSSMTLFSLVESTPPIFQKVLDKFFNGEPDQKTIQLLNSQR
ncbi:MAG: DUF1810 domain-containing protein [Planctomycetaceae bacterium]|jgi:uncharacterized protein (DUF1810 family)|nr:DUF1810 domain-containing protein [Planctomycetaceae bacterium]